MITVDAEHVGPWVYRKTGGYWVHGRGSCIGKLKDGLLVAGVVYEDWNRANVICHIAGEEGWATPRFLAIIFDYPFKRLGVDRITVPICSSNEKSIQLVLRLGFRIEAKLSGATSNGDMLIFRMFKHECRYLEPRYGKRVLTTTSA